jgi:hypothetical protein
MICETLGCKRDQIKEVERKETHGTVKMFWAPELQAPAMPAALRTVRIQGLAQLDKVFTRYVYKKLLTVTVTNNSRTFKFTTKKTLNPNTGKSSAIDSEFSAQNWNARTLRHLKDIHGLGEVRFNEIFNMASNSRRHGG